MSILILGDFVSHHLPISVGDCGRGGGGHAEEAEPAVGVVDGGDGGSSKQCGGKGSSASVLCDPWLVEPGNLGGSPPNDPTRLPQSHRARPAPCRQATAGGPHLAEAVRQRS